MDVRDSVLVGYIFLGFSFLVGVELGDFRECLLGRVRFIFGFCWV